MIRFIASGFGCGYAKVAPGTFGSAGGLALGALLLWRAPALLPVAGLLATLLGLWAVHRIGGDDDPGWITIDEVAGQLLALLPLSTPSPLGLLAAFALFRLLDILKPGPVGWADRHFHGLGWRGGWGIMFDDLVAAFCTLLCISLWQATR